MGKDHNTLGDWATAIAWLRSKKNRYGSSTRWRRAPRAGVMDDAAKHTVIPEILRLVAIWIMDDHRRSNFGIHWETKLETVYSFGLFLSVLLSFFLSVFLSFFLSFLFFFSFLSFLSFLCFLFRFLSRSLSRPLSLYIYIDIDRLMDSWIARWMYRWKDG